MANTGKTKILSANNGDKADLPGNYPIDIINISIQGKRENIDVKRFDAGITILLEKCVSYLSFRMPASQYEQFYKNNSA